MRRRACCALALLWPIAAFSDTPLFEGSDAVTGIRYTAHRSALGERLELRLPSGRIVVAELEPDVQRVRVRVVTAADAAVVGLSAADIDALRDLGRRWPPSKERARTHMANLLGWLSEAPPDLPIDVDEGPAQPR